jgi:hypothetical protein
MKKKITMYSPAVALLFFAFALLACGVAAAGPVANTQQFQQKAVKSAARGIPDISSQSKPVDVNTAVNPQQPSDEDTGDSSIQEKSARSVEEKQVEGQPAEEKIVVEEEKVKIEISEKEIASRVPSYKTDLKDIVREAEANIRKIDDALKAEDAEKGAKEHYDKGTAFYNEGKFEEAGKEWNTALGLAKEREFRKCIRASLKRAARQIRIAKDKREAQEWAKKKDQLRGKPEVASKPTDLKKE